MAASMSPEVSNVSRGAYPALDEERWSLVPGGSVAMESALTVEPDEQAQSL
jgi:hypothetical protein